MRLAVIIGCLALVLVSWMTLLDEACFAARSLVYFSSPSCSDCLRVRDLLRDVESRYPDITVMEISIANENGQMLLEEYCRYCDVNEDEYGLVPTVCWSELHAGSVYQLYDDGMGLVPTLGSGRSTDNRCSLSLPCNGCVGYRTCVR